MYISVQTRKVKDKVTKYVYLLESIRDPKTGKNTKRKIQNFGRLDVLEKENPGFLDELKKKYKSREDRAKERQALAVRNEEYIDSDAPDADLYESYSQSFIYGHFVLKRLWSDVLKMHDPLTYLKNQKYKTELDLNALVSTLVFKKALGGSSLQATYNNHAHFLGTSKEPLSLSDMYSALDIIQENKDMLIARLNRAITQKYGEDRFALFFYELANTNSQVQEKGFEHQAGTVLLVIDKYGLPVDYELISGSGSEVHTLREAIEGLQAKYTINSAIVVADSSLNSEQNLNIIKSLGMGFIVSHKVSDLGAYEQKMLDLEGYQDIYENDPCSKYKIVSDYTNEYTDGSEIASNLIFTFDEQSKKHDDVAIDQAVAKVEQMVKDQANISHLNSGYAAYAITKESSDGREISGVNHDYVAKQRALAGYRCMEFLAAEDGTAVAKISVNQVASLYGQLKHIEDCFRIMQCDLEIMPVFGYTSGHIKAHVLLCFMALTLVCLLKKKLHDEGHLLSLEQIIDVMNNMSLSKAQINTNTEPVYIVNKAITDDRTYRAHDVANEGLLKEVPLKYAQFAIMRAVGLYRLPSVVSKTTLSGCLRTKFLLKEDGSIYI